MNPLVQQITEQVIAALAAQGEGGTSPVRAWASGAPQADGGISSSGRKPRVLYVSNTPDGAPTLSTWSGYERHLLAGQSSGWTTAAAQSAGFAEVHFMHDKAQLRHLLESFDVVCLALHRYQELANLANLCDECWDVRVMLMALELRKKTVVDLSAVHAVAGIQTRVDEYTRLVRSYGFEVLGAASATAPAAVPSGPVFGGFNGNQDRYFAGGAAASASAPAPHGEQCLLKTTGECGGLGKCARHLKENVEVIVQAGADRVSTTLGGADAATAMAPFIDHTLLKADATREQVIALCDEARKHVFASVCINPTWVSLAAERLAGSPVKVCTVIGFPLGATTTVVKAMETRDAIANGAQEIDMVINVGALKAQNYDLVRRDIAAVVEAAQGALVKVILETALLTDEEKVKASQLSMEAGADFVKTSTGFGPGGATDKDVALMRQTVGQFMGVKASGGIRDFDTAQKMVKAGATRIGASASVAIVKGEAPKKGSGY